MGSAGDDGWVEKFCDWDGSFGGSVSSDVGGWRDEVRDGAWGGNGPDRDGQDAGERGAVWRAVSGAGVYAGGDSLLPEEEAIGGELCGAVCGEGGGSEGFGDGDCAWGQLEGD